MTVIVSNSLKLCNDTQKAFQGSVRSLKRIGFLQTQKKTDMQNKKPQKEASKESVKRKSDDEDDTTPRKRIYQYVPLYHIKVFIKGHEGRVARAEDGNFAMFSDSKTYPDEEEKRAPCWEGRVLDYCGLEFFVSHGGEWILADWEALLYLTNRTRQDFVSRLDNEFAVEQTTKRDLRRRAGVQSGRVTRGPTNSMGVKTPKQD